MKFLCLLAATVCVASPLAEGRELKFLWLACEQNRRESPLAEGRELK